LGRVIHEKTCGRSYSNNHDYFKEDTKTSLYSIKGNSGWEIFLPSLIIYCFCSLYRIYHNVRYLLHLESIVISKSEYGLIIPGSINVWKSSSNCLCFHPSFRMIATEPEQKDKEKKEEDCNGHWTLNQPCVAPLSSITISTSPWYLGLTASWDGV
jgi:hypothetical protein